MCPLPHPGAFTRAGPPELGASLNQGTAVATAGASRPETGIGIRSTEGWHSDELMERIAKTTNFAHTATKEDVRRIYNLAFKTHYNGVTVYRDGSRDNQVLSTGATAGAAEIRKTGEMRVETADALEAVATITAENDRLKKMLFDVEAENLQRRQRRSRPDMLRSTSIRKETPLGVMFVHVSEDDKGQPFDVFINLGKAGDARGGLPPIVQCDNGTEFTSTALNHWAYRNKVQLDYSRPGKPVDNCVCEAFNGSLRRECLSQH